MSQITADILAKVAPHTPHALRDRFIPYFNECLPQYEITTKERVSAFLTTVCFESDYFKALSEYASGWAYDISQNPKKARELGNTVKGDGPRYKGAGGIETTGKKNYKRLSDRLGVDFVANPGLLRTEKYFVVAACVFWDDNNFNDLADDDEITRIENITNRGSGNKTAKALDDRLAIYRVLMAFLPDDFDLSTAQPQPAPLEPQVQTNGELSPQTDDTQANQPDVVPSNGSETPVPDGQALDSTASTNILTKVDAVGNKVQSINQTASKFQLPTLPTGLGTKLSVLWKQVVLPIIMGGIGWLTGHWVEVIIIIAVFILAGTAEWAYSRYRNNPVGAVPPEMINPPVAPVEAPKV